MPHPLAHLLASPLILAPDQEELDVWRLATRVKTAIPNGPRIENLCWRLMSLGLRNRETGGGVSVFGGVTSGGVTKAANAPLIGPVTRGPVPNGVTQSPPAPHQPLQESLKCSTHAPTLQPTLESPVQPQNRIANNPPLDPLLDLDLFTFEASSHSSFNTHQDYSTSFSTFNDPLGGLGFWEELHESPASDDYPNAKSQRESLKGATNPLFHSGFSNNPVISNVMVGNVSDAHTSLGRDNRTLGGPGAASSSLSTFTVEENEHNSHHQPNHAPQMYKLSQIYESSGMTTVKNEEYDSVSQSSGDDLADGNDSDFEEHHQRPPLISEKFSFEMPPMAPTTSGESGTKSAAALHHERKLEEELKKRTGNPSISCVNCETNHTPLWRRDAEGRPLCNACGLFLKLHGTVRPKGMWGEVRRRNRKRNADAAAAKAKLAVPSSNTQAARQKMGGERSTARAQNEDSTVCFIPQDSESMSFNSKKDIERADSGYGSLKASMMSSNSSTASHSATSDRASLSSFPFRTTTGSSATSADSMDLLGILSPVSTSPPVNLSRGGFNFGMTVQHTGQGSGQSLLSASPSTVGQSMAGLSIPPTPLGSSPIPARSVGSTFHSSHLSSHGGVGFNGGGMDLVRQALEVQIPDQPHYLAQQHHHQHHHQHQHQHHYHQLQQHQLRLQSQQQQQQQQQHHLRNQQISGSDSMRKKRVRTESGDWRPPNRVNDMSIEALLELRTRIDSLVGASAPSPPSPSSSLSAGIAGSSHCHKPHHQSSNLIYEPAELHEPGYGTQYVRHATRETNNHHLKTHLNFDTASNPAISPATTATASASTTAAAAASLAGYRSQPGMSDLIYLSRMMTTEEPSGMASELLVDEMMGW